MNTPRRRRWTYLVAMATALCAGRAAPVDAHAVAHCAAMVKGIAAMQAEVDGLRRSARRARDAAQAGLLARRADVEQSKVDGMRHNLKHCSKGEPHGDTDGD